MRRMKKVAAATLTAMMVASLAMGTTETWARSSKRAAWNNAAAESADVEMEVRMPVIQRMEKKQMLIMLSLMYMQTAQNGQNGRLSGRA